jgi:hypothetical protein
MQHEGGEKLLSLARMSPAFSDADVGEFKSEEAWRNEASTLDAPRHRLALRLTEQQRRDRGRVDDLSDGHDRRG